jgi:predicted aspartyl protease
MNRNRPVINRPFALLLAIATALSLGGCQLADMARFSYANASATHQWSNARQATSVPFRLVDNHIILPVSVNGSEPLDFVLDSGAAATVIIDSRATRALQLEMGGELPVSGTGTGPHPIARIVPATSVRVGELSLDGQAAIFLALDSIPFFDDLDDVYFDGVIGAPFFRRFAIEIDHDRGLVSFSEPAVFARQHRAGGSGWQEVPLQIESGVPYTTARVDTGRGTALPLKLLVDTGFRGALSLTPSTSDELLAPTVYFESISEGLSGEVTSHVAMVQSLSLAQYRLQDLPARYALAGGESQNGSNGILGNEVLQQFNLVFDYARERLLLTPNRRYALAIGADRSGLLVRPHAAGAMVRRIAPGSSGQAAGLQVGDIITAFDDTPVTRDTVGALKQTLSSGRDRVHLCWESAGVRHCGDLALASRFETGPGTP